MCNDVDFHGIYPMLYAFYRPDGSLDRDATRRQVDACIAQGVHGIAVGGLATETHKLSSAERRTLVQWVAEDVAGRVPLSVTIAENTADGQLEFARLAHALGASWVVLQPPPVPGAPESELVAFYASVAERAPLPVGIQNAPEYIGIGVSNAGFVELNRQCPNVCILKAEGPAATYIAPLAAETGGVFRLFNGRNGVDLTDSLRAGCHGIIPGVDTCDVQVRIYELMAAGKTAEADRRFAELLPLLSFLMLSIDHLLCYGKRLAARRLGLPAVVDRTPAQPPTPFALEVLDRWSAGLAPY